MWLEVYGYFEHEVGTIGRLGPETARVLLAVAEPSSVNRRYQPLT